MAPTIDFLTAARHPGDRPRRPDPAGGQRARRLWRARARASARRDKIIADAKAVADAGAFCIVVEGVMEQIATEVARQCRAAGHRHRRLGRVRRPGAGHRGHARPVRAHAALREALRRSRRRGSARRRATYADEVRARSFPTADQTYRPKSLDEPLPLARAAARRARRQLPFISGGEGKRPAEDPRSSGLRHVFGASPGHQRNIRSRGRREPAPRPAARLLQAHTAAGSSAR